MAESITPKQNLVIQSYLTVSLLAELKNNNLIDSYYFNNMRFGNPSIKTSLKEIGVDNQGCAMMTLYAMLVLPKELIENEHLSDYEKINHFLQIHTQRTNTTYASDSRSVNYLRHIRNAVAHAKIEFRPGEVITFSDENQRKKEAFYTELPLAHLGQLIHELQMVHLKYIQNLQLQLGRDR